uniref:ATP synthase subunit b, chloroplastic n=1 Tax=Sonderella linearis TaxID=110477 RepID=A0A1Z1MM66_9FLOR|nr:ATP synthase CF0 subunit I [Sonderella linearis]ARW67026.1 ATP synthase CF0 subunit I [Sonderella linearis]
MQIFEMMSQDVLHQGISFNFDFLEANVINITFLLSGLIYVLKKFLGSILSVRQSKVLFAISESEERLEQANIRLNEAQKQLNQTQIIIKQIIEEAEVTAKRVRESILKEGQFDIERLTISSKSSIRSAENQVRLQIQQQITALAIKKVGMQLRSQITSDIQDNIINNNIMKLKDEINI